LIDAGCGCLISIRPAELDRRFGGRGKGMGRMSLCLTCSPSLSLGLT
jgi:hypothetical protein